MKEKSMLEISADVLGEVICCVCLFLMLLVVVVSVIIIFGG